MRRTPSGAAPTVEPAHAKRDSLRAALPRVLFISYSAALGGAERVLLDWASGMPRDVVIACPEGPLMTAAGAVGLGTLVLRRRTLELRSNPATRLRAAR